MHSNQDLISLNTKLDNGLAIFQISPQALTKWFNLPEKISSNKKFKFFIGALKLENKQFYIDGIFKFNNPIEELHDEIPPKFENNEIINTDFKDKLIINESLSKKFEESTKPLSILLNSLIRIETKGNQSKNGNTLIRKVNGPFVFLI